MKITIEKAEIENVPEIAKLFDSYRVFYGEQSDIKLAETFLNKRIISEEAILFYARDDKGDYLGFTQLFPSFSSVSAKRLWILNDLFVIKNARRLGIGKMLLDRAKVLAFETNAKGISLETSISNTNAQALYESLAYVKNTEQFHYFLDTENG